MVKKFFVNYQFSDKGRTIVLSVTCPPLVSVDWSAIIKSKSTGKQEIHRHKSRCRVSACLTRRRRISFFLLFKGAPLKEPAIQGHFKSFTADLGHVL